MFDRDFRMMIAVRGLGMLAVLALLFTASFGANTSATAQGGEETYPLHIRANTEGGGATFGAQFTVTAEDGEFLGACTLEGDANSPAYQYCWVDVPKGLTVIVWQDPGTIPASYAPVENPIAFDTAYPTTTPHKIDVAFHNVPQIASSNATIGRTGQVAIFTTEDGQPAYDSCYVLVDYSNVGCDENRDGRVMFADIPWGTYTIRQTADLGPGRSVIDFLIEVRGNVSSAGWEGFGATIISTTGGSMAPGGSVDIALITRDPQDGHLLTGTCYVLVGYSNEGCNENADGQVTFAAIPYGTYTVHQTSTPAGYPTINDFDISVEPVEGMPGAGPFGVPLGFIVKQAPDQNAPDSRNVSVVLIDMKIHERVPADVCVELVGASNVGCDEDLRDGQIDFLDVPAGGPYELRFSNLPAGYEVATVGGPLAVSIDAESDAPSNRMIFVLLAVPQSGTTGSGNGGVSSRSELESLLVGCGPVEACLSATVTVSTQGGAFISSCTLPDIIDVAPWVCNARDVPRGTIVALTIDGIAPGYVAEQNPVYWDTTKELQMYEEGGIPSFSLVPTSGRTSSGSSSTGKATTLMTFQGCPEGFDPNTGNFYADCTIPLDAPDASIIAWGGDGQGGMNITGLDRQYDGAYIYNAGSLTMNLQLSGMAPVVRDAYQVVGADGVNGDTYTINLINGETREVFVFYYFE